MNELYNKNKFMKWIGNLHPADTIFNRNTLLKEKRTFWENYFHRRKNEMCLYVGRNTDMQIDYLSLSYYCSSERDLVYLKSFNGEITINVFNLTEDDLETIENAGKKKREPSALDEFKDN